MNHLPKNLARVVGPPGAVVRDGEPCAGIALLITAIFLVANTIRLAIYAKRKIIMTMKLVGATRMFIRLPFLVEGIIQVSWGGFSRRDLSI